MTDRLAGSPWSAPGTVAGFAKSPPNAVLMQFAAGEHRRCPAGRVLDIGCGAARNAVPLAESGWDVIGTDLSKPMIVAAAARAHAAGVASRLHMFLAPMDALPVADRSCNLVIAHGIWNLARSSAEFRRAVREAARVARPGAGLFVFTFSRHTFPPDTDPVAGEPFVFTQFSGQPQCFLTGEQLVAEMQAAGFAPEPIYGERDVVDLEKFRALGRPFWLAGGYGNAAKLREALAAGATGIQVGAAFAFCDESGLRDDYKRRLIDEVTRGTAGVFTDPLASPTSFPFKVAQLAGTLSDQAVYDARPRVCDLGYLREAYRTSTGEVGFRCSAEPVNAHLSKGGQLEDTVGRKCICNALLANIGLGQIRGRSTETGIVTTGDDLLGVTHFLAPGQGGYTAADGIARLLGA